MSSFATGKKKQEPIPLFVFPGGRRTGAKRSAQAATIAAHGARGARGARVRSTEAMVRRSLGSLLGLLSGALLAASAGGGGAAALFLAGGFRSAAAARSKAFALGGRGLKRAGEFCQGSHACDIFCDMGFFVLVFCSVGTLLTSAFKAQQREKKTHHSTLLFEQCAFGSPEPGVCQLQAPTLRFNKLRLKMRDGGWIPFGSPCHRPIR